MSDCYLKIMVNSKLSHPGVQIQGLNYLFTSLINKCTWMVQFKKLPPLNIYLHCT